MKRTAARIITSLVFTYLLILCDVSPAISQPGSFTVFGPLQFDKPKGKPITYSELFSASYPVNKHFLWVESGSEGLNVAKNVSVSVNGIEVVSSADLRAANPVLKEVNVQPNNTLSVTLKGKGGNFITVKVLYDPVRISLPLNGAIINKPFTNVAGVLDNLSNQEMGIVVNGIPAYVSGNEFIANHVPLTESENTITVTAADTAGNTFLSDIMVYGEPVFQYIALSADEESGIIPMDVNFTIETVLDSSISSSELQCDGPGTSSITNISPTEYFARFTEEGLYICTAVLADSQWNYFDDNIGINVMSEAAIDLLLRAKWNGMKDSLLVGDIYNAVSYFAESSRESFQRQFTEIQSVLPQVVNDMGDTTLIQLVGDRATYDLRTMRNGETYSFQLLFVKDKDGIWRINSF